ncbi:MAG: pilus assembly protein TadG-related protein [Parvularculaceae bacterium]
MTEASLRSFAAARGGNIAILFALMGVLIVGAGGFAIDYMRWGSQRAALQEAADAGAIAGAVELGLGGAGVVNRASQRAEALSAANQGSAIAGATPVVSVDKNAGTVAVSFDMPAQKTLSALLFHGESRLSASATAKVAGKTVACIYALNATAPQALKGNGSAIVQGTNCAIYVNSNDGDALANSGTITANHICVVGGYSGAGYSPMPQTSCPPINDPFAAVAVPAAGPCGFNNLAINSNTTLNPGVYCGGLSVTANAVVTLTPGLYFMIDGPLFVRSGASVLGDEVSIILSGTASVDIAGSGEVVTTPPLAGPAAGFSVMQDRAAPLGEVSKITGEGRFEFPGIIYLPRQALDIAGRAAGNVSTPSYAAIIADTITVSGSGDLYATADTSMMGKNSTQQITVVNAKLIE